MLILSLARRRTGSAVLVAVATLLAVALVGASKADAIGLGPAGWYSFGASNCNGDSRSDPIGVLFRGRRASASNVAKQVKLHTTLLDPWSGWIHDVSKGQYLWVLLNGGGYDCREANESVAEASDAGPYSRFHTRLWFIPATNGSSELKTIGTPHHEDWITYNPLNNHCTGVTGAGSHAVDQNGSNGSGFDQGRHKLKEAFEEGGHKVESEEWGNTEEIEQCDEGLAGSNGWGHNIWVNHAMEPSTKNASSIKATSSTLNGALSTEETTTEWWFAYGPNHSQGISGYPFKTPAKSTSATGAFTVSEAISNLSPNTTYYVRMFARNQDGEVEEGDEIKFRKSGWRVPDDEDTPGPHVLVNSQDGESVFYRTPSGGLGHNWRSPSGWVYETLQGSVAARPPMVSTGTASTIVANGAKLEGPVNPEGSPTSYYFEYGTTASYGSKQPVSGGSILEGFNTAVVSETLSGLTPNTVYHYRLKATSPEGTTDGIDKTFVTPSVGTATQLANMLITEPFNGSSESLANFSSKWSALGWAAGTTPKGENTTSGWRPLSAYSTINGAYYNSSFTDTGPGIAAAATMATNPGVAERYFSLWLDMQSPGGTRAGYELRFTNTASNTYEVKLSKWMSGTETVLSSKSGYLFTNGNSFAIVDVGGTVSAWTDTGSGFGQLLSAGDSTFSSGNAGLHGAGNFTRLTKFKAGGL